MSERNHIQDWFRTDTECLSAEQAEAYHLGKLTGQEKHAVERHLLTCDLCAEAWDGLEIAAMDGTLGPAVTDITDRAWTLAEARERKKRRGAFVWMSAAAGVALLVVAGFFLYKNSQNQKLDEVFAQQYQKYPVEESVPPPPSESEEQKSAEKSTESIAENLRLDGADQSVQNRLALEDAVNAEEDWGIYDESIQEPIPAPVDDYAVEELEADNFDADISVPSITEKDAINKPKSELSPDRKRDEVNDTKTAYKQFYPAMEAKPNSLSENTVVGNTYSTLPTTSAVSPKKSVDQQTADRTQPLKEVMVQQNVKPLNDLESTTLAKVEVKSKGRTKNAATRENAGKSDGIKYEFAMPQDDDGEKDKESGDLMATRNYVTTDSLSISPGSNNGTLGAGMESKSLLQQGIDQYQAGNYAACLELMKQELLSAPQNPNAHFYSGLSKLGLNLAGEAIPFFNTVLNSSTATASLKTEAAWYKALALIKNKEVAKAKDLLNLIIAGNGKYASKAKETLKSLN